MLFGHVAGRRHRSKVNGLKNVFVELARLGRSEGQAQLDEGIRQTLHSQAHWTMAHIGIASLGNRVVVLINYVVEVVRHLVHDIVEHLVVKGSVVHILRQGD